jgi:hypothetical protein
MLRRASSQLRMSDETLAQQVRVVLLGPCLTHSAFTELASEGRNTSICSLCADSVEWFHKLEINKAIGTRTDRIRAVGSGSQRQFGRSS